jgi:PHD/YefM family antitoxin component YafN of YafNO toxin-antitoxin module
VFLSQEEWGAIDETLDVLRDEEMLDDLRASAKDVKANRLFSLDQVRRELGLV